MREAGAPRRDEQRACLHTRIYRTFVCAQTSAHMANACVPACLQTCLHVRAVELGLEPITGGSCGAVAGASRKEEGIFVDL